MSLRNAGFWRVVGEDHYRPIAGVALITASAVLILGIITAEALFPDYSTKSQTISALGAARGTPASRAVFNSALIVSGVLLMIAAYGLHLEFRRRPLSAVIAVSGIGVAGAALFPSETGLLHGLAAILAFVGFGLAALVTASVVRGTFGYVSGVLGVLELTTLLLWTVLYPPTGSVHGVGVLLTFISVGVGTVVVAVVIRGPYRVVAAALGLIAIITLLALLVFYPPDRSIHDFTSLGVGGLERWVAYLALVWFTSFGGYLLGGE